MIVAGLQLDIVWEAPQENFAVATAMAWRAVRGGAQLLVLPEMFATGFTMDAEGAAAHAETTRGFLADLAHRHQVWVMGGYVEPGPGRPLNACALFDPKGAERLRYHKIHPFTLGGEPDHYDGGAALHTVDVEGVRVTPVICYDLRFPELFRATAAATDLFVVIANWPAKRRNHWKLLLRARAVENQCFVLGANRVGEGGGEPHTGDSALIDPLGGTRAGVRDVASVLDGTVDPAEVADVRRRFSFLADRRPEVYGALEGGTG